MTDAGNDYDAVPYPAMSNSNTNIDRIGLVGWLRGMRPADPNAARVLELGSGSGIDILSMAGIFPGSTFLGVDYSARQVAQANAFAEDLGLSNARFVQADLLEWDPGGQTFDYVIAHGVYSWVPAPVRARVLELMGAVLAPQGLAYVSFNALPGAYYRQPIREMMRFATRGIADPRERVSRAVKFLDVIAQATGEGNPAGDTVKRYLVSLNARWLPAEQAAFTLHDELAPENESYFLREVVEAGGQAGLQYVDDVLFETYLAGQTSPLRLEELAEFATTPLELREALDFASNRNFHRAVFSRSGVELRQTPGIDQELFLRLHFRSDLLRGESVPMDGSTLVLTAPDFTRHEFSHPLTLAALTVLDGVHPRSMKLPLLAHQARGLLQSGSVDVAGTGGDEAQLARDLVSASLTSRSLVSLHLHEYAVASAPAMERPRTPPVARAQVALGVSQLTTLLHERTFCGPMDRALIPLLDGTRDRGQLRAGLREAIESGRLVLSDEFAGRVDDASLGLRLEEALEDLAKRALLFA